MGAKPDTRLSDAMTIVLVIAFNGVLVIGLLDIVLGTSVDIVLGTSINRVRLPVELPRERGAFFSGLAGFGAGGFPPRR